MSLALRWIEFGSAEYQAMLELRNEVLRKPLGRSIWDENRDHEANYHLLTAWQDDEIVGCLTLSDDGDGRARMRAVAVSPLYQGQGIGAKLVAEFETKARALGFSESFAHAREVVIPFYMSLGYEVCGEEFEEVGIPHLPIRKGI